MSNFKKAESVDHLLSTLVGVDIEVKTHFAYDVNSTPFHNRSVTQTN